VCWSEVLSGALWRRKGRRGGDGDHGEKDRHGEIEKDGLILLARNKREEGGLRGLNCLGLLHKLRRATLHCLKKSVILSAK